MSFAAKGKKKKYTKSKTNKTPHIVLQKLSPKAWPVPLRVKQLQIYSSPYLIRKPPKKRQSGVS